MTRADLAAADAAGLVERNGQRLPGYWCGGMWGSSARASRYTAWPPIGCTTGTPAASSASPRYAVDRIR